MHRHAHSTEGAEACGTNADFIRLQNMLNVPGESPMSWTRGTIVAASTDGGSQRDLRQTGVGEAMKLTTFLLLLTCAASAAPVGKRVDIGGRTLHIVCMGEGPRTVLMESGAAEGFYEWWLVQSALKGEIRTCSYDRAGFGWSDPPSSERSVANYISDLHELL